MIVIGDFEIGANLVRGLSVCVGTYSLWGTDRQNEEEGQEAK